MGKESEANAKIIVIDYLNEELKRLYDLMKDKIEAHQATWNEEAQIKEDRERLFATIDDYLKTSVPD